MGYLIEHTCFRFVEIKLQIKSQMKKLRWLLLAQFFQCFILLQSRILHSSFTSKFEDYNNAENLRKVNFLFSKERNQLIKNEHFGVTAITNKRKYHDKHSLEFQTSSKLSLDLDEAQDRQLLIPFNPISLEFIGAKYENLVKKLPSMIDTAREQIIKDIASTNMLGYVLIVGFALGAICDTIGFILLEDNSLSSTIGNIISDAEYFGLYMFIWWYGIGEIGIWLVDT